ncbi:alpha/beta-hydrolase [Russula earlei]|uniref:Alpha/beta-hydrolase n=1 Tax=Russula earlei TaxID=71964 RepID=A0ACC0U699_9AGAM|nr:alpha/beta-hydrolase [Russula earlei]
MDTVNAFLDKYGRFGLDAATAASTIGFAVAKASTKFGFGVTRGLALTVAGVAGSTLDHALGDQLGASSALNRATSVTFGAAEQLALVPIFVGEGITSASLIAAYSSIDALASLFPKGQETSFSIASFISLMRNDWSNPELGEHLPEEHFSVGEAAKALFAWGTLQGVTYDWQIKQWSDAPGYDTTLSLMSLGTSPLPYINGHLVTADITQQPTGPDNAAIDSHSPSRPPSPSQRHYAFHDDLRLTLRRLSKMCLAGYGGASFLFFGVPATPPLNSKATEKETLEAAVDESEKLPKGTPSQPYPWWSMLLGKHDHDIFLHYARGGTRATDVTAVIGDEARMPRFWVLTDHSRRQIVLVFRGTMTLNEVAVDLTCEPEEFEPASATAYEGHSAKNEDDHCDADVDRPRSASFRSVRSFEEDHRYLVHGGILKMSLAMGAPGRPVFTAVEEALSRNPGYELVMCGHSLGAGVAGVLGLKWADPNTCLTTHSSGLPVGRRVSVYCFAPPAAYDLRLCDLSKDLITSFVYSHDLVSRLSLGSLRDMSRAAVWLCKAEAEGRPEGYTGITRRALRHKMGFGSRDDPIWFLSIRKTLEANMPLHNLYPPGRVLWAVRDSDVSYAAPPPAEGRYSPMEALRAQREGGIRLFEVLDVEKVFTHIIFSRDMISSHMAHMYDKIIEELQ